MSLALSSFFSSPDRGCIDAPTEWFYPDETGQKVHPNAVELCEECPVKDECRTHALTHEEYGYWAGMTAAERNRIRDRFNIRLQPLDSYTREPRAACGTERGWQWHRRHFEIPVRDFCPECADAHNAKDRERRSPDWRARRNEELRIATERAMKVAGIPTKTAVDSPSYYERLLGGTK